MTILLSATAALFLAWTITALWHLRWVRRLPAADGVTPSSEKQVRCSVIVAARDEGARIEGTICHILAQQGVEIELIVVDDRSSDRTGEVLARLAIEDGRVRVRRVDELPEGWIGKCHACHIGAGAATGDWLLFTDADCWLKPDVIARALRVAERDEADHVTMTPGTVIESFAAQAWHIFVLTGFLNWFSGVNRNRPKSYMGIGAFNLVRADAYRQCGGYEALRLTVVDDIRLGLLLSRAGKRTRAFLGMGDVECHWGTTVKSMIKLMEKNYFAAANYRVGVVLAASVVAVLIAVTIVCGLISGTTDGLVAGLSPLLVILPATVLANRLGWSRRCAILVPFMPPLFIYTMLKSTFVTLRQGGIRWRETFYPLKTLRAGSVR